MVERGANRVRALREARRISQGALAAAVSLSRQSVHAIESGRAQPAVDVALRFARVLACSVEALFGDPVIEAPFTARAVGEVTPGRVALAHISGRWLSYSLGREGAARAADGLASRATGGHVVVEGLRSAAECRQNVVIMGCAPALGLLADRLNSRPGPGRFSWLPRSSMHALTALGREETHLAGVHLVDAKTGEANLPAVRRQVGKRALVVITLARWEAGLVVASGNPKRISSVARLGQKGIRLVSREAGSGARQLLERELRLAQLPVQIARAAALQAAGHLEVAQAIAVGAGDAGIATRDAALAFGLAFVPLAEERYDLVVPSEDVGDTRLARLFEVMSSGAFRRELSALGYDVEKCGDRIAEIQAA